MWLVKKIAPDSRNMIGMSARSLKHIRMLKIGRSLPKLSQNGKGMCDLSRLSSKNSLVPE